MKRFFTFALVLFGLIFIAAAVKKNKQNEPLAVKPIEIEKGALLTESQAENLTASIDKTSFPLPADHLPDSDRVSELFRKGQNTFPFIETVTYKSSVPWKKGRAAWVADYASHYNTSRHFIARSLNGKADYFKQDVANGDRFNIFNPDRETTFYLVIDLSRVKMWVYAFDEKDDARYLVKTYPLGLGVLNDQTPSGSLTPLGTYLLGTRTAIYKPGVYGIYKGEKTEMIKVFGTRWIPFEKEVADCTEPAAGYGIHGSPWSFNSQTGKWVEERDSIGSYSSDGCIRLKSEDVEELFAIISARKTFIEIVDDFEKAHLPGSKEL